MKLFFSLALLLLFSVRTDAQVTALSENFDVTCDTTTSANLPVYWTQYCRFTPISVWGWNCYPVGGRYGTPGFTCNSYYSMVHYADTAWLFTPILNLASNSDHVYLRYDSKYEYTATAMRLMLSRNYAKHTNPDSPGVDWHDVTVSALPIVGPDDSVDWVTHYVDLTPYKADPLIFTFKYTSTNSSGGRWTIDNVMTTPWGLNVAQIRNQQIPLSILGAPTSYQIDLACDFNLAGAYKLSISDLLGREVHSETLHVKSGRQNITVGDLQLRQGMYFVKVSNGATLGVVKAIVQ